MSDFPCLDLRIGLAFLLTTTPCIIFRQTHLHRKSPHLVLGLRFSGLGCENLVRICPYDIPPCSYSGSDNS